MSRCDPSKKYQNEEDFKNMYIDEVDTVLSKYADTIPGVGAFLDVINSDAYAFYEKMRNVEYHCLRQEYFDVSNCTTVYCGKMTLVYELIERLYPVFRLLVSEEERIVEIALCRMNK